MANDALTDMANKSEKELALWMLARMRDSEEFLGVLRAARITGKKDLLDTPGYTTRQQKRLGKLFQADGDDVVDAPAGIAAVIDQIVDRDVLSGREELIEKALRAYLDAHPKGDAGLPKNWQTTIELARSEIEGRETGAFDQNFVSDMATAARLEIGRLTADRSKTQERGGRGN